MPGQLGLGIQTLPRVDRIVERCMRKDPAERFQSAAELQRAIRTALRDFPDAVREFPTPYQAPAAPLPAHHGQPDSAPHAETERVPGHGPDERQARRSGAQRSRAMILVAAAVVALAGVAVYFLTAKGSPRPSGEDARAETAALVKEVVASLRHGGAGPVRPGAGEAAGLPTPPRPGARPASTTRPAAGASPSPADPAEPPAGRPTAEAPGGASEAGGAPSPKLDVGERVDGFPLPKGARISMTTPQALMLESPAPAADLLAFFRAHVTETYGPPSTIPNGIQVPSDKAPFSYITLMNSPTGEGIMVVLTRNVLFQKAATGTELQDAFGVAIMPGAKIFMRTAQIVTFRTRKPASEVFDFYENLYGKADGVTLVRQDDNDPPVMSITTANKAMAWQSISIVGDPSTPGSLIISVMKR